jgi:hypothetical protein
MTPRRRLDASLYILIGLMFGVMLALAVVTVQLGRVRG